MIKGVRPELGEFSYDELGGDPAGYSTVKRAAQAARNFACDLNSRFPGWASSGAIPGSPADTWTRAFWRDMCANAPTPAPEPILPYNGGQCAGVYRIRSKYFFRDTPDIPVEFENFGYGPLAGAGIGFTNSRWSYGINGRNAQGNPAFINLVGQTTASPGLLGKLYKSFSIILIERADGGIDNCGNPFPQPPPDTYAGPQDEDRSIDYPPFPAPSPPGTPPWKISIPLAPIFISPQFDVKVDVGGLTFKLNIDKVTFDLGNKSGDGSPGSFDGVPGNLATSDDVQRATDAANEARRAAENSSRNSPGSPRNDPAQQDKTEQSEDEVKKKDGIQRLIRVDVELTQIPVNARIQEGNDGPDVVYAGWFEFRTLGKSHPRQPIHFQGGSFLAPEGVDGYAYTLYQGFRGKATEIKAKEGS